MLLDERFSSGRRSPNPGVDPRSWGGFRARKPHFQRGPDTETGGRRPGESLHLRPGL